MNFQLFTGNIKYKFTGRWDLKAQYHYTMETQTCVAVPVEDNLDIFVCSQWPAGVQEAISIALNIPEHRYDGFHITLGLITITSFLKRM